MFIVRNKNFFFILSGVLTLVSLASIFFFGLRPGIEFTGGVLIETEYSMARPDLAVLRTSLEEAGFHGALVQEVGIQGIIVRTRALLEGEREKLLAVLSDDGKASLVEKRFTSIGPSIGTELKRKAWVALGVVVFGIILFIAFAFRKVSEPVSSWKYGIIALIALIHDLIIPVGAFAFLGSLALDYELNVLFVTALLAILGFSIHDTIVVFDRVRENLRRNKDAHRDELFSETVGKSLSQTIARSINTSLTVVIAMGTLYFIGGVSTQQFALVLTLGVIAGVYSSICLASPLLLVAERLGKNTTK